jgi:hypothetical protein
MAWVIMMTRSIDAGVEVGGLVFKHEADAEEHSQKYTLTGEFDEVWLEYVTLCGFKQGGVE